MAAAAPVDPAVAALPVDTEKSASAEEETVETKTAAVEGEAASAAEVATSPPCVEAGSAVDEVAKPEADATRAAVAVGVEAEAAGEAEVKTEDSATAAANPTETAAVASSTEVAATEGNPEEVQMKDAADEDAKVAPEDPAAEAGSKRTSPRGNQDQAKKTKTSD